MKRYLELERLEDRQLLSASAVLNAATRTLVITGTDEVDHISIAPTRVIASISNPPLVGRDLRSRPVVTYVDGVSVTITTYANGATFAFPLRYLGFARSAFDNIVVDGQGDNDTITNGSSYNSRIYGGDGDDTIVGGSGRDRITGGLGNDTIDGGLNNDKLVEDADTDLTLTDTSLTGLGNDTLTSMEIAVLTSGPSGNIFNCTAFTGKCELTGGIGADEFFGGSGDDTIHGGAGDDILYGNAGIDHLYGDEDSDIFNGGNHEDHAYGSFDEQLASAAAALFAGFMNDGVEHWHTWF